MALSLIGKGALIKGIGAVTVLSGASVGGWYLYSNGISGFDDSDDNMKLEIKNLSVGDDFSPTPMEDGCFKKFFSEALFTKGKINEYTNEDWTETNLSSGSETSIQASGCSHSEYSSESVDGVKKFAFELETSINKNNVGIVAWLDINSNDTGNQRYQVYLLKKENEKWNVKFGFISDEATGLKEIKGKNDSSKLVYSSNKWSSDSDRFDYSKTTWKNSNEEGKSSILIDGIFNDLKTDFKAKYTYTGSQWYKHASSKDVKAVLEKWFKPFENTKGIWE